MLNRDRAMRVCLACVLLLSASVECRACPFCSAPSLTLTERAALADAVALGRWHSVTHAPVRPARGMESGTGGQTHYEIVELLRGKGLRVGQRVSIMRERIASPDEFVLLLGERIGDRVEWTAIESISHRAFRYLSEAPPESQKPAERLRYFLTFLEDSDQSISNDAFGELANAPYDDIVAASSVLSRERLREWIGDPKTSVSRTGVYGLLLGLCGDESDARWLEEWILRPPATDEFRLGLDGQIGGYLVLTGNAGLDVIERHLLRGPDVKFSDRYAAMQALRFAWSYGGERFSKERLRAAMRALLDDESLLDLVIADLSRWEDWSVQDRLMELFRDESLGIPSVRRAVVRYLLTCARIKPQGDVDRIEHAARARRNIEIVKGLDPLVFKNVERYFRFESETPAPSGADQRETPAKATPPPAVESAPAAKSRSKSDPPSASAPMIPPPAARSESSARSTNPLSRTLAVCALLLVGLSLLLLARRAQATARSLTELRRAGVSVETRCDSHAAPLFVSERLADWWPSSVQVRIDGESSRLLSDTLRRLHQVPAATHLVIQNARLNQTDLDELVRLPRLTQLALHDCAVAGTWDWLTRLRGLACLSLRGSDVTDAACAELACIDTLQHLDLIGSRVTDAGAAHFTRLSRLTYLDLRGTAVSDHLLATLSTLPQLEVVDARGTRVTPGGGMLIIAK